MRGLREPPVTAGGSNIIVGFGTELWRRLRPNDVPADSGPFETIEGAGQHRAGHPARHLGVDARHR